MQDFATGKAATWCNALHQLTCFIPKTRKAVRIMKLTAIFLLAACLQVSARGWTQAITISVKDAPLLTVLKAIERQTDFVFFVNNKELQKAKKVTLDVTNIPLQQVLELCFKGQPLGYSITGKVINVFPKEEKIVIVNQLPLNPPIDVKGKIVNESGEPVLATITVKGTGKGANTNENGEFQLNNVEDDAILVITGIGLESKELKLDGNSSIYVTVNISVAPLQETIIKGYYSTARSFNTGNVTKVKGEEIHMQPVGDPMAALIGRVPGLQIIQKTGAPGRFLDISIRGVNSIANGTSPLIIVDGMFFFNDLPYLQTPSLTGGTIGSPSPFNGINPADIESVEVLKDADATAIYGSRGANGVIIITTRKGKAGKTKVEASFYSGFGKITRTWDLLNSQQYLQMRREAFQNDIITPTISNAPDLLIWDTTSYTDWQKVLLGGHARYSDVQVSMSGGNENTQFLLSSGYHKETTIYPGDFYDKKISIHFNLNHSSVNKKFRSIFSTLFTRDDSQLPAEMMQRDAINLPPNAPSIFDSSGKLNWANSTWTNPYATLLQQFKDKVSYLNSSLDLSYELITGLQIKSRFGYTLTNVDQIQQFPKASYSPTSSSQAALNKGTNNIEIWNIEPQIAYSKKIGSGVLDALIGSTFLEQNRSSHVIFGTGFSNDALINNIQAAATVKIGDVQKIIYHYNALFGRVGYNWKQKYLINLTARRDGSSRFGTNNRFSNFGAVGLGWIFTNEEYFKKNISFVSYGKVRGSYGSTGNDQIGDYQYLENYDPTSSPYLGVTGLTPIRLLNADFAWEEVKKLEIAFELSLFKNRIFISSSYFRNRSANQLLPYPLPGTTGFVSILKNIPAIVENAGLEFELNTINISTKNFKWNSSINISFPKNKLIDYPDLENSTYANRLYIGQPLSVSTRLKYIGIDPVSGLYTFEDFDNDGSISSPNDYKNIIFNGKQFYGGFRNGITFKNWQLDLFFQFVRQKNGLSYTVYFQKPGLMANQSNYIMDRWQKAGDVSDVQKFSISDLSASRAYSNAGISDFGYSDASFIRLKSLYLSYQIPTSLLTKIHFTTLKIFVQSQNLLTITSYKGLDPENQGPLPPLRVITSGLHLTF
jgi:TonB-dependent starch-binding outer membrane protein SusC